MQEIAADISDTGFHARDLPLNLGALGLEAGENMSFGHTPSYMMANVSCKLANVAFPT